MATARRNDRAMLRRCGALVRTVERSVGIPVPFDLEDFLARLRRLRSGRPIVLVPLPAAELPTGTCGLWVALSDQDAVGYPEGVPRNHRDHIVLHEVGHMLAGHRGVGSDSGSDLPDLLPDLDPAMVRSVLGRSVYGDPQEREAELVASLIMHRTLGTESRPRPARSVSEVVDRLERTLDN